MIWFFCVVLGGGLLGYWILDFVFPYTPIMPTRTRVQIHAIDGQNDIDTYAIRVDTNITLKGLLVKTDKPKAILIVVHGIGSCKENYYDFARFLQKNQFNAFIFDQRAHGESGGKYCTFGYYEKRDVRKIVDTLSERFPHTPIGIFGASLGGAVALQSLANDRRLAFGIIESTFNTLQNVIAEYGRFYVGFRSQWLAHRVLTKSALIANFDPFSVKPEEAAKKITQPIFFAHGNADDRIPMELGRRNFENVQSLDKEFYVVEGGHHSDLHEIGGAVYLDKLRHFLNRQTAVTRPLHSDISIKKRFKTIQKSVLVKWKWQSRRFRVKVNKVFKKRKK